MKIAVVGGGGVGGYIAAKLSEVVEVDLISSTLQSLQIRYPTYSAIYHPTILTAPPKSKIYDLIIFATKSFVLEEKASLLLPHINEQTTILPLLNGIEPYTKLCALFPKAQVLKGAIYIIANRIAPNTIEIKGKGAMVVMEDCGPKCQEIAKLFERAGIKVNITKDIDRAIWQKYLFITATAALTTLYNKNFGQIAKEHLDEFEALLDEIIAIAQAQGIALNREDKLKALKLLQKSPPEAQTSMQLDFQKRAPSELDNIIGYLAKRSPTFATLYHKLKELS